jgi:hypothetical protein
MPKHECTHSKLNAYSASPTVVSRWDADQNPRLSGLRKCAGAVLVVRKQKGPGYFVKTLDFLEFLVAGTRLNLLRQKPASKYQPRNRELRVYCMRSADNNRQYRTTPGSKLPPAPISARG